jgi:ParB family chromosome partitioning protein
MGKTIIDAPRAASSFMLWPEEIVIVGLDTLHKRGEHPLWDERAFRGFSEPSVLNMMVHRATLIPAVVVEIDEDLGNVVADGRGRILDSREANRRLREQGLEPFRIEARVKRAVDAATSFAKMVVGNAFATSPTLMEMARKAHDMIEGGIPMERVMLEFGRSEQTIKQWCELVQLPPEFRRRVERGQIGATQAVKLARSSKEQQAAALRVADARGAVAEGERPKRQSARELAKAAGKTLPPTRKDLRALLDRDEEIVKAADRLGRGPLADAFFAGLRHAYEGAALPAFIADSAEGDPIERAILTHGLNERGCVVYAVAEKKGDEAPDSIHARLATAGISIDPAELSKTIRAMHKAGRIDKTSMGYRLLKAGSP